MLRLIELFQSLLRDYWSIDVAVDGSATPTYRTPDDTPVSSLIETMMHHSVLCNFFLKATTPTTCAILPMATLCIIITAALSLLVDSRLSEQQPEKLTLDTSRRRRKCIELGMQTHPNATQTMLKPCQILPRGRAASPQTAPPQVL